VSQQRPAKPDGHGPLPDLGLRLAYSMMLGNRDKVEGGFEPRQTHYEAGLTTVRLDSRGVPFTERSSHEARRIVSGYNQFLRRPHQCTRCKNFGIKPRRSVCKWLQPALPLISSPGPA
jgi:hypothetical protein